MALLMQLLRSVANPILIVGLLISPVIFAKETVLATSYAVQDLDTGEILAEKNSNEIRSIASITKLMTAIVVLDAKQDLNEKIVFRTINGISSKIPDNFEVTRSDLLLATLMSSDNGAAKTLAIHYPGGESAAIRAMNTKATDLGMTNSKYHDPTGLSIFNVSTVKDLVKLMNTAYDYKIIREFSTRLTEKLAVYGKKIRYIDFRTTNNLIAKNHEILLSKTGWIRASGGCLAMIVNDQGKRLAVILLNSKNTHTRIRDGELLTEHNNVRNNRNFR
jgi:D-alanyl-D-alanine endopeptidase (penicillin-binding protein 7)